MFCLPIACISLNTDREKREGGLGRPAACILQIQIQHFAPESNGSDDVAWPAWETSAETDPKDSDSMQYP